MTDTPQVPRKPWPLTRADTDSAPWLVIDVETTGFRNRHEITQLGMVYLEDGLLSDPWEEHFYRVLPSDTDHPVDADPVALELTGYDPQLWRDTAIPIDEALQKLFKMWEGCILAAYQLPFELRFIDNAAKKAGVRPRARPLMNVDALTLVRPMRKANMVENIKLSTVCKHYDISLEDEHNALADARRCFKVLRAMKAQL